MKTDKLFPLFALSLAAAVILAVSTSVAQVSPTITLDPASGGANTQVTVNGTGFPANARVWVYLGVPNTGSGREAYSGVTTDANGTFDTAFVIPGTWPDGTTITAHWLAVIAATDDGVKATAEFAYAQRFQPLPQAKPEQELKQALVSGAAQIADWQVFRDDEYGVQIQYPLDWTYREIRMPNPELEAPVVRIYQFMPQEWAAQMNPGERPDPSRTPVVAPVSFELRVGTLEEYRRMYPQPDRSETLKVGGNVVTFEENVSAGVRQIRYFFHHPANGDPRVTLVDQISGFPDRAKGNENAINIVQQMLSTFAFTR